MEAMKIGRLNGNRRVASAEIVPFHLRLLQFPTALQDQSYLCLYDYFVRAFEAKYLRQFKIVHVSYSTVMTLKSCHLKDLQHDRHLFHKKVNK